MACSMRQTHAICKSFHDVLAYARRQVPKGPIIEKRISCRQRSTKWSASCARLWLRSTASASQRAAAPRPAHKKRCIRRTVAWVCQTAALASLPRTPQAQPMRPIQRHPPTRSPVPLPPPPLQPRRSKWSCPRRGEARGARRRRAPMRRRSLVRTPRRRRHLRQQQVPTRLQTRAQRL